MRDDQKWAVTTTTMNGREWGIRFERARGFVFALQLNWAPAIRITLFGWSLYVGRLIKVTTTHYDLGEIAASKGWVSGSIKVH